MCLHVFTDLSFIAINLVIAAKEWRACLRNIVCAITTVDYSTKGR